MTADAEIVMPPSDLPNGHARRDHALMAITCLIVCTMALVTLLVILRPPADTVWPFTNKVFEVLAYGFTTALGGLLGSTVPRKG